VDERGTAHVDVVAPNQAAVAVDEVRPEERRSEHIGPDQHQPAVQVPLGVRGHR
jgi:hypothetical protein